MVHAQKKGKAGEKEFCKWLDVNLYNEKENERNYNQSDGHSADIETDDFLFEIKRCEALDLDSWWHQVAVANQNHGGNLIHVVAFRQNNKKWEFLIPASTIGIQLGYIRLSEKVFKQFAQEIVNFSGSLTDDEQRIMDIIPVEDIQEINRKFHVLGRSKRYLAHKYEIPFKVVSKIVGK